MTLAHVSKYRDKKKKMFGEVSNLSTELYNIIKRIKTLVYIAPHYVKDVFTFISKDSANVGEKEENFVNNYLQKHILKNLN